MSIIPDFQIIDLCKPTRREPTIPPQLPMPKSAFREVEQQPLIEPFNEDQVEPASYDVRLGNHFRIFERDHNTEVDLDNPVDITKEVEIRDGDYFTLHPGEFVLGYTRERVYMPDNIVARIEGKSSVGRLGILVHVTAGFIDPGFIGNITLEMASLHPLPVKLRPGKLIAQLSFEWMAAPARHPYNGRYQGDNGVVASRYGKAI